MIVSGLEANKMHFKSLCKAKRAFLLNFTISPLNRPIKAEFTNGLPMKTSLINILCL